MQPIIVTTPLELLHIDFTSIETTMELDQPLNMSEAFGLLQPLFKKWHGIHNPLTKLQRLFLSFCGKDIS